MKFRDGFVSNSSSSSFLVQVRGSYKKEDISRHILMPEMFPFLYPEKTISELHGEGFEFCGHTYASRLEESGEAPGKSSDSGQAYMFKQVACNEAEVVEKLVELGVFFTAATHYGHYGVFFTRDDPKRVYVAKNYGREIETYGRSLSSEFSKGEKPVKSQTVKSILKSGWNKGG